MASIAGCQCPPDGDGGQTHRPGCALEPRPAAMPSPSQISLVLAAVERLRLRAYRTRGMPRTADEIMAEAIAAKNARHRINPIPWLGRWGSGDFHTSPSGGAGSRLDVGRLPDAAGSTNPVSLEGLNE